MLYCSLPVLSVCIKLKGPATLLQQLLGQFTCIYTGYKLHFDSMKLPSAWITASETGAGLHDQVGQQTREVLLDEGHQAGFSGLRMWSAGRPLVLGDEVLAVLLQSLHRP